MEWASQHSNFSKRDLDMFQYRPQPCTVVRRLSTEAQCKVWLLETDSQWSEWFQKELTPLSKSTGGLYLIIGSRSTSYTSQSSTISHLPFSRDTFKAITEQFHAHRTITRTINRNVAYFSRTFNKDGPIGFTARMSASWAQDLALSATFFAPTGTTFAIIYGCNKRQEDKILARLHNSDTAFLHPLLSTGILCELDRDRLVGAADCIINHFVRDTILLTDGQEELQRFMSSDSGCVVKYLENYTKAGHLARGLKDVQCQLRKLIAAVDEMEADLVPQTLPTISRLWQELLDSGPGPGSYKSKGLTDGQRIKERLKELIDEYEGKTSELQSYMKESSHTIQTVTAQLNTTIALAATRDNQLMRSVAFITMAFLPPTFIATVFSMELFNWDAPAGQVVSRYFWVYFALAVGATLLTFMVYFTWTAGKQRFAMPGEAPDAAKV